MSQGGDMNARFARMNVNAQPFIPNAGAQPFVPAVYPPYGYPAHGPPQMHPSAVYGHHPPPGMHMGIHQAMPPHGGHYMMPPGMAPPHQSVSMPQQHPVGPPKAIPVSALETEHTAQATTQQRSPFHQQLPDNLRHSPQVAQPWDGATQHGLKTSETSPLTSRGENDSPIVDRAEKITPPKVELPVSSVENARLSQDNPVDSWEDIADGTSGDHQPSTVAVPPGSGNQQHQSKGYSFKSDVEQAVRKNPSPVLSKGKSSGEGEAAQGRGVGKAGTVPPPKKEDDKENVNIVFIGHVDAGKSTIGGHVMYLTGQVDKRTLEKYEREAKEKNRETWYLSWALDTNQEERDKGKTVEVGRAAFETDKKRFTILDAPGHAGFVPNMISGTAQADVGVLVISARRGEFETGFERRGQTREHAMLAKTAGVKHLVVLINKMDDPTVNWSEERYEECKTKLTPFLKRVGFNPKTDLFFIPVSGLTGINLKDPASKDICPWYSGPAFIPYLEDLPSMSREDTGPFRMPIADKYKDMGTVVMGKVESGGVVKGSSLLLMPNRVGVEVLSVIRVEEEVAAAYSGDNIKLKLKGVEEEDISAGFVLCGPTSPCHVGHVFDAQIVILEHKSIICAGYSAVLHIHSVVEEVQITQLIALIDKRTGKKTTQRPRFVKQDQVVIARLQTAGIICLETFQAFPQMARFTLRDEGKTIAIGKVLKLVE